MSDGPVNLDDERAKRAPTVSHDEPDTVAPPREGPTMSRLDAYLALRGIGAGDLKTDFVGWNAIDIERDVRRGEFPWRAVVGPEMTPIDEARLGALLAGAMPTEGEAATLSDAFYETTGEAVPRGWFLRDPLPVAEHVHVCGLDEEADCACGKPATLLCDGITGEGMYGSCDTPLCAACAHEAGPEEHYCAAHKPTPKRGRRVPHG